MGTPAVANLVTTVNGNVAALATPGAVLALAFPGYALATARADMLLPPGMPLESFTAIQQNVYSVWELGTGGAINLSLVTLAAIDTASPLALATGPAYAGDASLGQLSQTTTSGPDGSRFSLVVTLDSFDTIGAMPVANYCQGCSDYVFSVVTPYSAALNPSGFTYQTFGSFSAPFSAAGPLLPSIPNDVVENWFSVGIPTDPLTLPAAGAATYSGRAGGMFVNAVTRDPSQVEAVVTAIVDFAARTVAFSTSSTTSLSINATGGTPASPNAALNLTGTLAYAAGSNTFTGAVTTTNGLTGHATCRFYGAAILAPTPGKVLGSPPEMGCTFALLGEGVGAMYGALGAL